MDEKLFYYSSVVLSLAALVLLIADISLFSGNRSLQMQVNDRQAAISKGVGLGQINQALVQLLADASIKNNDADIRSLLTEQGITVKPAAKAADDKDATAVKDTKKK